MPLSTVRNDITAMKVDAIVNAAKESLLGGSVPLGAGWKDEIEADFRGRKL